MNNTITQTTSNHKKESISNFLDASIDDVFIKGSKTYLRIKQLALPLEKFRKKFFDQPFFKGKTPTLKKIPTAKNDNFGG